uniref:Uncharacterized protein n=1 Tax=Arundo donax TaxID=35708 RepID=A0A0A9HF29_ARUDO
MVVRLVGKIHHYSNRQSCIFQQDE